MTTSLRQALSLPVALTLAFGAMPSSAQATEPAPAKHGPVLLVQAHPDDETMLGGTLGYLAAQGIEVYSVCITRGEGGHTNHVTGNPKDLIRLRPVELQNAAKAYRIRSALQLEEPDAAFRDPKTDIPTHEVEKFLDGKVWNLPLIKDQIQKLAERIKPEVVLTFYPKLDAVHGHHQAAGAIAMQLFKEGKLGGHVQGIYAGWETNWYPAGTFQAKPNQIHFKLTEKSKNLGITYAEFQEQGARAHATQDTGHRGILPADEVLEPLYEKDPKENWFRKLARQP